MSIRERDTKHPAFIVYTEEPLNGSAPPALLAGAFVTPTPLFFSRNHGPTPQIDPTAFRLTVDGLVGKPLSLSLEDLRNGFPAVETMATLQCAGNRRDELMSIAPIPNEVPWNAGAISNAVWRGVRLADVLAAAGVLPEARHAAFTGLDVVHRLGRDFLYGGSIPVEKALAPETLLAYAMNGAPLEPLHGFPLRVVVPGYIGARSVKWVTGITLQTEPSDNYFQAHAYKLFPPEVNAGNVDWDAGQMLGEIDTGAVICSPENGQHLPAGSVRVSGYAVAAGGVERVEVSCDDGATWHAADLTEREGSGWAWCFWTCTLRLPPGSHDLLVRAWDRHGKTQAQRLEDHWNFKGYMNNAWHRVRVQVLQSEG